MGLAVGLAGGLAAPALHAEELDQGQSLAQLSERPATGYIEVSPELALQRPATTVMYAPGGPALPIYLNRWGGTYTGGWDDSSNNVSSIVNGTKTVSAFSGTDNQWQQVLSCVQEQFAPFNVYVTDLEPVGGSYIEAVVGGSPGQIGMPNGVGGVAPYDPYGCQVIDSAVVYAFADVYLQGWGGGTRELCETATQEIAHAMTLDHALLCEDPMTYLYGCGDKWFQDTWSPCGEYEERECSCQRPAQNSVAILNELIGPSDGTVPPVVEDNEPPVVSVLSPEDGQTFQADTTVQISAEVSDDVGLVLVQLYWEFNDILLACPGDGGGWSCTKSGDTYTWSVTPGVGSRPFSVRARDVAGHEVQSETRTVWFTEDGLAPPEDNLPPEVAIVSPQNGAELQANSQIQVVVTASDDSGIAQIGLVWNFSDQAFPCPFQSQSVTCTASGSTYTWDINVGDGSRTFSAYVRDLAGNEVTTAERTITLVNNPAQPQANDAYEDNDTWEQATPIGCGDTLELIADGGDPDWFRIDVPAEQGLRFVLAGEVAEQLTLSVASGPFSADTLVEGEGVTAVELVPEQASVGVRVEPKPDTYGAYTLTANCVPADDILVDLDPNGNDGSENSGDGDGSPAEGPLALVGGCSSADADDSSPVAPGTLALLLAFLPLVRRRRR